MIYNLGVSFLNKKNKGKSTVKSSKTVNNQQKKRNKLRYVYETNERIR